jgi:hypothetical protein
MKTCNKCKIEKSLEFFGVKSSAKDGINPKCRDCVNAAQRKRNKIPVVYAYNIAKNQRRRALELALPCTLEDKKWGIVLEERFGNRCFLTGSTNVSMEHFVPFATGHGGHIIGNVIPMDDSLNKSRKDKNFFLWFETLKPTPEMREAFNEGVAYLAELNGLSVVEFRQYVFYCDQFRRTEAQIKADSRSSVQIFLDAKRGVRLR